jgi:hypothetical protein
MRSTEILSIWMRKSDKVYEYIAVYGDDIAIAMNDPKEFIYILEGKYKFKTKGSVPLSFYLGMNLNHDDYGTICINLLKYSEKNDQKLRKDLWGVA